jgi:hypothetical protein
VPLFFFDVQTNGDRDADERGTELASASQIGPFAMDLALEIAKERMPEGSEVVVSVRSGDGIVYSATLSLTGSWLVSLDAP